MLHCTVGGADVVFLAGDGFGGMGMEVWNAGDGDGIGLLDWGFGGLGRGLEMFLCRIELMRQVMYLKHFRSRFDYIVEPCVTILTARSGLNRI